MEIKIKKSTFYFVLTLILIIGISFFMFGNLKTNSSGNVNLGDNGEVQQVTIGMRNSNYYPNVFTVESGKPVQINLDKSVQGCFRDFTIRELNIRKYLPTPEDSLIFTPNQKGTYTFACSMGMGVGKLIVE